MTSERRRWLTAALSLCVVAGLQLAAVPPEVFADPGVCFMECSVEGRSCCCKGLAAGIPDPHAPEAEADGRLAAPRLSCRELCAVFAGKAPGDDMGLFAEIGRELARLAGPDRTAPSPAISRRLDQSDPSTLPRPPPSPNTFLIHQPAANAAG